MEHNSIPANPYRHLGPPGSYDCLPADIWRLIFAWLPYRVLRSFTRLNKALLVIVQQVMLVIRRQVPTAVYFPHTDASGDVLPSQNIRLAYDGFAYNEWHTCVVWDFGFTPKGELLMLMTVEQITPQWTLQHRRAQNGSLVEDFDPKSRGETSEKRPRSMVVDSSGTVYILFHGVRAVTVYKPFVDRDAVKLIGGEAMEQNLPHQITLDRDDCLLVSSVEQRCIFHLNKQGDLLRTFLIPDALDRILPLYDPASDLVVMLQPRLRAWRRLTGEQYADQDSSHLECFPYAMDGGGNIYVEKDVHVLSVLAGLRDPHAAPAWLPARFRFSEADDVGTLGRRFTVRIRDDGKIFVLAALVWAPSLQMKKPRISVFAPSNN